MKILLNKNYTTKIPIKNKFHAKSKKRQQKIVEFPMKTKMTIFEKETEMLLH